jgi:hypothetical protein
MVNDLFKSWPNLLQVKFTNEIKFYNNTPDAFTNNWAEFVKPIFVNVHLDGTNISIGRPPAANAVKKSYSLTPQAWEISVLYDSRIFVDAEFNLLRVANIDPLIGPNYLFHDYKITMIPKNLNTIEKYNLLKENQSLNANIENLVNAKEFETYLNAYVKYNSQVEADKASLQKISESAILNYDREYNEKANTEISDLQTKKIQILIALDNESKSTVRDFQNMLLNAQNLQQTIKAAL